MRNIKSLIVLSCLFLTFVVGCDSQNEEIQLLSSANEELKSENVNLTSQVALLNEQLNDQNSINIDLRERIQQLENQQKELSLLENQIKYDLSIPLDVFEVIQKYFYSINNKDLEMLKSTTVQHIYESKVAYINSINYKEMFIEEMTFQSEHTYQSDHKTTESIVVRVKHGEKYDNSFVLQNTNNAGWIIFDID